MVPCTIWCLIIGSSLLNFVTSQTLSLLGNFVPDPTTSTKQTAPTLKECARVCMEKPQCRMFVYNTNNKICEIATAFTAPPTRQLNRYEFAYLRGISCAPDRKMTVQTRKIGKFYSQSLGHRFMGPAVTQIKGMGREEVEFCQAINDDVPECNMISFGSADNGKSLTKVTTTKGYKHYGYCTLKKGSCNANYDITEYIVDWPVKGNVMYANWPKNEQPAGFIVRQKFFCYFWTVASGQCTKALTSNPFTYSFQMRY